MVSVERWSVCRDVNGFFHPSLEPFGLPVQDANIVLGKFMSTLVHVFGLGLWGVNFEVVVFFADVDADGTDTFLDILVFQSKF